MTEELPIGQAEHAGPQRPQHRARQRALALAVTTEAGAEQHMRAVLQQADQPQLRERAGATPRSRTTKPGGVGRAVGDIKSAAVQADQPPVAIPRPRVAGVAIGRTNRSYSCRSGSSPSRLRAWEMALLPATLTAAGPQIARSPSSRQRSTSRRLDPMESASAMT